MKKPTLSDLISLGEGFTTEFKRSLPSDLGREICAFANATGGVILIGVDDAGTVVGVANHNRLKSQVQSVARSVDPPVAVEMESEGEVLLVTVPGQHSKPYAFRGRFFIREGASCQQLSRDEIRGTSSSRKVSFGWTRHPATPSILPWKSLLSAGPSLPSVPA